MLFHLAHSRYGQPLDISKILQQHKRKDIHNSKFSFSLPPSFLLYHFNIASPSSSCSGIPPNASAAMLHQLRLCVCLSLYVSTHISVIQCIQGPKKSRARACCIVWCMIRQTHAGSHLTNHHHREYHIHKNILAHTRHHRLMDGWPHQNG